MLSEKEHILLSHLRQNSRKSLAKISFETNIPVSTLFNTLRKLESKVVKKHVSLVDFQKLGHNIRVNYAIKSRNKKELKDHLLGHPQVNSLSSLINDYDFYAECVFEDMKQAMRFKDSLEKFGIEKFDETFIIEDVKKEAFGL